MLHVGRHRWREAVYSTPSAGYDGPWLRRFDVPELGRGSVCLTGPRSSTLAFDQSAGSRLGSHEGSETIDVALHVNAATRPTQPRMRKVHPGPDTTRGHHASRNSHAGRELVEISTTRAGAPPSYDGWRK